MSTEAQKRASLKWAKANYKQISLFMNKEYYSDVLLPFVQSRGLTMRGFILDAINHYMKYLEKNGE